MRRERLHGLIDMALDLRESLLPKAPEEAMTHFRKARREALLGVAALVEHALARLEEEEAERSGPAAPQAIPVE